MDKETLSKYGWVVIVIIVLVILMSFAAPFGNYFSNSTMAILDSLTNAMAGEAGFVDADKIFSEHFGSINNSDSSATTSYTLEEIESDEHLYAIGKTQPEYVVAEFNDDYTEVVITKNGDESDGLMMGWDVLNDILSPMTEKATTLQKVSVKDGVVSIGQFAFCGLRVLTVVDLPNTLQSIGPSAFMSCSVLTSIDIPESVSVIEENAFFNTGLTSFTMPNSVMEWGESVFGSCSNLKTVILSENITTIPKYAFDHCTSLEKIIIPNSVKRIEEGAFLYCTNLSSITLGTDINFFGSSSLQSYADSPSSTMTIYVTEGTYAHEWAVDKFGNGSTTIVLI